MAASNGPSASSTTWSILVVEDDAFMASALVSMLKAIAAQSADYGAPLLLRVEQTASGEGAWDLLNSRKYHIALVDIKLPGITGLDLSWCYQSTLREGTGEVTESDTIMIACTSDIDPADLYEHGMKDVLRKPVTMAALRHMLHKWMPRRTESALKLQPPRSLADYGKTASGTRFSARILAVEDCEVTAMATQMMFQEMGLWIETAADGEQAMKMLAGGAKYDLLLLDVNLPGISGYALCSWYKEQCRTHERPCATIVAVTSEPDKDVCAEFGFDRVLPKPLTAEACYHVLQRWLDARNAAAASRESGATGSGATPQHSPLTPRMGAADAGAGAGPADAHAADAGGGAEIAAALSSLRGMGLHDEPQFEMSGSSLDGTCELLSAGGSGSEGGGSGHASGHGSGGGGGGGFGGSGPRPTDPGRPNAGLPPPRGSCAPPSSQMPRAASYS